MHLYFRVLKQEICELRFSLDNSVTNFIWKHTPKKNLYVEKSIGQGPFVSSDFELVDIFSEDP